MSCPCATWGRNAACLPKNAPSWEFEDGRLRTLAVMERGGRRTICLAAQVNGIYLFLVRTASSERVREVGRYLPVRALAYTRQARNQHYACGRGAPSLTGTARILACNLIERAPVSDRSIESNKCEAGTTPQNEIARYIALYRGAF